MQIFAMSELKVFTTNLLDSCTFMDCLHLALQFSHHTDSDSDTWEAAAELTP